MRNFIQHLKNLKNLMTNFKEAWVNFVNFVNFVMQNFKSVVGYRLPVMEAVCAAEGTQKERQYPTNLQRIFNLSLTPDRLRSVCALVALMMVMGVANAWGDRTNQGTITIISGKGKVEIDAYYKYFGSYYHEIDSTRILNTAKTVSKTKHNTDDGWVKFTATADPGYTFYGWCEKTDCTDKTPDITNPKEYSAGSWTNLDVTRYTKFTPNSYTIVYNGNGSTHGSTASTAATYDANVTFRTNGFYKAKYVVTYNINGGTCGTAVDTAYYPFTGWATSAGGAVVYTDGQTTTTAPNLATSGNGNLYAKWGSGTNAVTLPTPTAAPEYDGDGEYTFAGWYDGETKVGVEGGSYTPTSNVTLKAKWTLTKEPGFSGASQALNVGGTYSGFVFSNTSTAAPSSSSSANFYYVISQTTDPTGNRDGSDHPNDVISFDGTTVTALNNGVATIKFYQKEDAENNIAEGESATFTFTVSRYTNSISCSWDAWSKDLNFDEEIGVTFSSDNDAYAPIVVTRVPGDNVAVYDEENDKFVANYRAGSSVFQISQAQDYMYEAATTKNCTINVGTIDAPCYLYERDYDSDTQATTVGDSPSWSDVGVADSLFIRMKATGSLGNSCEISQKTTGGSYGDATKQSSESENYYVERKMDLDDNTTQLKFAKYLTSNPYIDSIRVTRKRWFNIKNAAGSEITSLAMPVRTASGDSTEATFKVEYSTCASTIKVKSDNPHIVVKAADRSFSSTTHGTKTITLKYSSTAAETITDAKVYIYTEYEHKTITVTAETKGKLTTRLEYVGAASYAVNSDNIAATTLFQVVDENEDVVESPAITLSTSATSVIDTVSGKTAVDFLCGGTARITASYAGDATYAAASNIDTLITVNKLNDVVTWRGAVNDTIHVWVDDTLPYDLASANTTAAKAISFTSSDASVIKVATGTTKDTLVTLSTDTITLTATTTTDCTYSSQSPSMVVVVDKCQHRIVWNEEFVNFTTDDSGNIKDSIQLKAYAVDSTGAKTNVTINYAIASGGDVACVRNGYVVVSKEGEAVVTAITASDSKYATASESREIRAKRPGVNNASSKNSSSDVSSDSIIIVAPHARFAFGGETDITQYYGSNGYSLAYDFGEGNKDYTLNWRATNANCSIQVTRISFWAKAYYWNALKASKAKVTFDGTTKSVGTASLSSSDGDYAKFDVTKNFSSGVQIRCTSEGPDFDFYIKNIIIEYTVYTTTAPSPVTDDVEEVMITVNVDDKQILDLGDLFSVAGAPDDFEYQCQLSEANDYAHIINGGTQFWADAAGDYTIEARVAPASDHRPSDWSASTKTIRVTRLPNKVYMGGSDSYSDTIKLQSTKSNVWLTATNTDYSGSPITCTQIAGMDTIRYNPSTGVFTSGNILGTGKWRVSQAQSDKYEAAADTFTVEIVNNTFEFTGETDGDWGKDGNWGASGKPTAKDNVTISGDLTVDEEIEVYSLTITGEAVVTIGSNGGLSVGAGGISGSTKDNLILEAGDGTGGTTKGKTGYIRFSPDYAEAMPEVTVKMYTIGYYDKTGGADKNDAAWQYVGAPVDFAGKLAKTVFTRSWIYDYNESTDKWANNRSRLVMEPFVGYATTQYDNEDGMKLAYTGKLINNRGVVTLDLAYSGSEYGHNMVANSFAAPIDITQLRDTDFVNAEQTIYIFNTGSRNQEDKSVNGDAAGQYRTIAIGTASEMSEAFEGDPSLPTTIAPMQGFWVNATSAGAKLKLDYNKLVWNADYSTHMPGALRAPKRALVEDEAEMEDEEEKLPITGAMKITMEAAGWSDHVYMLESERYDALYEDGYDAHKMESGSLNVFVMAGNDKLAIDATPQISGTQVGVRTGEETTYTLHFSYVQGETKWALKDYEAKAVIDINEGTEYTFIAVPNCDIIGRFEIVERADAPAVATGVDSATGEVNVQKFVKDGNLYVLKNGMLYNATGMRVK